MSNKKQIKYFHICRKVRLNYFINIILLKIIFSPKSVKSFCNVHHQHLHKIFIKFKKKNCQVTPFRNKINSISDGIVLLLTLPGFPI